MLEAAIWVLWHALVAQIVHVLLVRLVLLLRQLSAILVVVVVCVVAVWLIGIILIIVICLRVSIVAAIVLFGHSLATILNIPQLLCNIHHFELFQLECTPILHSDIFTFHYTAEVIYQMHQFLVINIGGVRVIEGYDGYAVRQLEAEAVDGIVDDEHLRQIFVLEDS